MKKRCVLKVSIHCAFLALLACGCSTTIGPSTGISDLDLPSNEYERDELAFLTRTYEAEGMDSAVARMKALSSWNDSQRNNEELEEEQDRVRIFPKTREDKRQVERLTKKYEEKGYDTQKARGKALDAWRNQTTLRIKRTSLRIF